MSWTPEVVEASQLNSERLMGIVSCVCMSESIEDVCQDRHLQAMVECFNQGFLQLVDAMRGLFELTPHSLAQEGRQVAIAWMRQALECEEKMAIRIGERYSRRFHGPDFGP